MRRLKDERFKIRTKEFALRIIRLYSALPKSTQAQVSGKQLLLSGTSVGAHYREGTRAHSNAEFIIKSNVAKGTRRKLLLAEIVA